MLQARGGDTGRDRIASFFTLCVCVCVILLTCLKSAFPSKTTWQGNQGLRLNASWDLLLEPVPETRVCL